MAGKTGKGDADCGDNLVKYTTTIITLLEIGKKEK